MDVMKLIVNKICDPLFIIIIKKQIKHKMFKRTFYKNVKNLKDFKIWYCGGV